MSLLFVSVNLLSQTSDHSLYEYSSQFSETLYVSYILYLFLFMFFLIDENSLKSVVFLIDENSLKVTVNKSSPLYLSPHPVHPWQV